MRTWEIVDVTLSGYAWMWIQILSSPTPPMHQSQSMSENLETSQFVGAGEGIGNT